MLSCCMRAKAICFGTRGRAVRHAPSADTQLSVAEISDSVIAPATCCGCRSLLCIHPEHVPPQMRSKKAKAKQKNKKQNKNKNPPTQAELSFLASSRFG